MGPPDKFLALPVFQGCFSSLHELEVTATLLFRQRFFERSFHIGILPCHLRLRAVEQFRLRLVVEEISDDPDLLRLVLQAFPQKSYADYRPERDALQG